jgi:hypothetical protein
LRSKRTCTGRSACVVPCLCEWTLPPGNPRFPARGEATGPRRVALGGLDSRQLGQQFGYHRSVPSATLAALPWRGPSTWFNVCSLGEGGGPWPSSKRVRHHSAASRLSLRDITICAAKSEHLRVPHRHGRAWHAVRTSDCTAPRAPVVHRALRYHTALATVVTLTTAAQVPYPCTSTLAGTADEHVCDLAHQYTCMPRHGAQYDYSYRRARLTAQAASVEATTLWLGPILGPQHTRFRARSFPIHTRTRGHQAATHA